MGRIKKRILSVGLLVILAGLAGVHTTFAAMKADGDSQKDGLVTLADKVQHKLVVLPYFGVFDHIEFKIRNSDTVVLSGSVVYPTLKSDAESAVKEIPEVNNVVNDIEILPLSRSDSRLRLQIYRAIYSKPGFEKYEIQSNPPIQIIVKNGSVTLEGYVNSKLDKQVAYSAARSVSGAFSVTDHLKVK